MSGNTSATGGYIREVLPLPASGGEITAALQKAIATITGLPGNLVRPRWQPIPPTQPPLDVSWGSIGLSRIETTDYPYIRHDGDIQLAGAPGPGADFLERESKLVALATFYGPLAEVHAGALRDGFYIQQNWELLRPLGLKLQTVRDLSWTPEFINQQWVDRVDIEITMSRSLVRVYPVLNIVGADVLVHAPPCPDELVVVREDTEIRP